jgi:hypothetical protein
MKECKDCRYYDKLPQTCRHDRAVMPSASVINTYYYPARLMRSLTFLCGRRAKYFVKKERFWWARFAIWRK